MSRASIEALLERNAKACETARYPQCVCHCGGAFHGKAHSREWLERTAEGLEGMAWWNRLSEAERRAWMARAGNTGIVADAWEVFKRAAPAQLGLFA